MDIGQHGTYFCIGTPEDEGCLFEGNVEQFQDCFFSQPDDMTLDEFLSQIKDWAVHVMECQVKVSMWNGEGI